MRAALSQGMYKGLLCALLERHFDIEGRDYLESSKLSRHGNITTKSSSDLRIAISSPFIINDGSD
jgi:hypothetical protein